METVFLVYKTDPLLSYASRDIISVCTTKGLALTHIEQKASREGHELDKDQIFNLTNYGQTQGYAGDGEFAFEEVSTNVLF